MESTKKESTENEKYLKFKVLKMGVTTNKKQKQLKCLSNIST